MNLFKKDISIVVLCSLAVAILIGVAAWDINLWPTDTGVYYLKAARMLPQFKYISQIHQLVDQQDVRWMHGKEMYILCASIVQRLINDPDTLRPFLLVCIVAIFSSSILIFCIAKRLWGRPAGFICYFMFVTCFWPYQQIIYTGHQPLSLSLFLLSVLILLSIKRNNIAYIFYALSGLMMCLSLYSSIAAMPYVPYYFAAFLYIHHRNNNGIKLSADQMKNFTVAGAMCLLGFTCGFIYFNRPDIISSARAYLEFVNIVSLKKPHFYYNQPILIQWIARPDLPVRGGVIWIVRYFMLIMPVLFPFYLLCISYLTYRCFRVTADTLRFKTLTICLIFLSLSTFILAETKGIPQLGRSYFTFFAGLMLLAGYALHVFLKSDWPRLCASYLKKVVVIAMVLIGAVHVGVNFYIFFDDVYPSRMATTFLSRTIKDLGIDTIYTYSKHPYRANMVPCLDPDLLKNIRVVSIDNIYQPKEGYILVPPASGNAIYKAAHTTFNDFDSDIYLNELFKKGTIDDYAHASFKALTSSKIWIHAAEVLSYKTLMLNHPVWRDINPTKIWLLDAAKLQRDIKKNIPSPEYIYLHKTGVRNIGTQSPVYKYEGFAIYTAETIKPKSIPVRIYKVGEPRDKLIAYVYKVALEQPVWIPLNEHFASIPIEGNNITSGTRGQIARFAFSQDLVLAPGRYKIVIHRTGKPDDKNFYRVYPRK